jgi:hypothetical protein
MDNNINNINNIEGFDSRITNNDLIKTLLFTLLFYILSNTLLYKYLKSKLPDYINVSIIQSLLFGCLYLFIIVNL